MDTQLKAKWVEALRSGEYEQGIMDFERNGKFCCLGVLCKVAGQPTHEGGGAGNWEFVYEAFGDGERKKQDGKRWPLVDMNDSGKTFSEIADYIEKNL